LALALQTESESDSWREQVLDSAAWEDRQKLDQLAKAAPVERQPVALLLALGERLRIKGGDSVPYLKRVQKEHPADFWANLILGDAMLQWAPVEAAGYYRAALASRPGAAVGYCAVGDALRFQKDLRAAMDYYEKALQIDATYARTHNNLGLALQAEGLLDEAIECHQKAVQLDPDYAWAHYDLGNALRDKGMLGEAYDNYQVMVRIDPINRDVQTSLTSVLLRQGRGREAQASWRKALDANAIASKHESWSGYPELCLFLGRRQEYQWARHAMLDRFGATTSQWVAEPVGRACLLQPSTDDETRKAVALIGRAIAAKGSTEDWVYRYFLFARGLADYRQGRLASAISILKGDASKVMGPAPRLVLAMAQYDQGQKQEAAKTLASAIVEFDWRAANADCRDVWIAHVLRREAEAKILQNLSAFLRGEYQPQDNDERLALLGICQFQGRNVAAASLFADALAGDLTLAQLLESACRSRAAQGDKQPVGRVEELTSECRYPAARCAALAGSGQGLDAADLSASDRTRWRKQARDWLEADLAMWSQTLGNGSHSARILVRRLMVYWQTDLDLAGIREPGSLEKLTEEERKECVALWEAVASVLGRAQTSK
jgi:serine/threonine-protein kinase